MKNSEDQQITNAETQMGKLISMTDFVLKVVQTPNINEAICWEQTEERLNKIYQYSLFLKQPLQLGFFVPCDENGKVLDVREKPNKDDYWSDMKTVFSGEQFGYDLAQWKKYEKAKERVLFKGFFYKFNIDKDGKKWEYVKNEFPHVFSIEQLQRSTIEGLLTGFKEEYKIELTDSAIKQIGL